jgi:sec-independent protein translocase protein TatB
MFDVGFWELSLIMVVVLLVVGPERLPKLARTAGVYVGKARRIVADVRAEVHRELRAQELKESMGGQGLEQLKDTAEELRSIGNDLKSDVGAFGTKALDSTGPEPATAHADTNSHEETESPKGG